MSGSPIYIDGKVIGYQTPQIRPIIGYVPDFMGAYDDMVVTEYLGFFAASYDIHGTKRKQVMDDVLNLTDLSYKADAEVYFYPNIASPDHAAWGTRQQSRGARRGDRAGDGGRRERGGRRVGRGG